MDVSWTVKKAEQRRTDAFELWCWRRFLRVPWTAKRSKQSILKEINPEYSLEGWCWSWKTITLATWCEELTWNKHWCWQGLKAGEGDDIWDGWMVSPTWWTGVWGSSGSWWWTGKPGVLQSVGSQGVGHDWVTELNWLDVFKRVLVSLFWILIYFIWSLLNGFQCACMSLPIRFHTPKYKPMGTPSL